MQTESGKQIINERLTIKKNIVKDSRIISTVNLSLTQRLLDEDVNHHLVVYADRITMKGYLYFPAKNISLHARIITLEDNCTLCTQVSEQDLAKKSFSWGSPKLESVPDFFESAFNDENKKAGDLRLMLTKGLGTITNDLNKIKNDVDWLNQGLQLTGIYTAAESKLQSVSPIISQLAMDTAPYRTKQYDNLNADEQKKIKQLNRAIIDALYPLETTKQLNTWLDFSSSASGLEGEGYEALSKGDGGIGKQGYNGRNGSNGIAGGEIKILAEQINFNDNTLLLDTRGTQGGRAENGGKGGYGGKPGESKSKVEFEIIFLANTIKIDNNKPVNVFGGWGVDISAEGHELIKSTMFKAGKGGEGGKAGKSGDGGRGGNIIIGSVQSIDSRYIRTQTNGGLAGPNADGGLGGDGGEAPFINMKERYLLNVKTRVYTGDRGPSGDKGKGNVTASAGMTGNFNLQNVDYDAFILGFNESPGLAEQRIMTFRALKTYYLKGGNYMNTASRLITWLLNITPGLSFIESHQANLSPAQRQELMVLAALRSNVEVLKGYQSAGVDFYGHSWNYTPVFSFDHYKSRISDMLITGKLVEDEHRSWAEEKRLLENVTDDLNKTIAKINAGTNQIVSGFSQLFDERREIERQLDDYRRQLDAESTAIWEKQRAFMEAVDSKLKLAFGIGCLNLLAQVVLISTGNVAYGSYLKYAGTAIDKIRDMTELEKGFTDPIKQSFESSSKAMDTLDKYKKDKKEKGKEKKEVSAKLIEDGDKQRIEIEINKKGKTEEVSKPGAFKEVYTRGVDVVQHVLPILGTASELWTIGKKMGEVQEKFGFDSIKMAMDNGAYENMIDQFAQYANGEAKEFKETIGNYMELVKNRNELLLNYRALQGKCAELYAKNALLNIQLSICRERMAMAEDPAVAGMDQFWAGMYDFMRDRILDKIYDEYKTYRFYSLNDLPFSETSVNNILRGQVDIKTNEDTIDEIELSPNITSLSVLQDLVAEKMFTAEEKQFGSWKSFRNDAGRVSFKRMHYEQAFNDLKETGKASFYVSPEQPAFKKLANVSINSVEAFFIRTQAQTAPAIVKVGLLLQHEGFVSIKNSSGQILNFVHNKPNPFAYEYNSFFDNAIGKKIKFNKADQKLTDRADDGIFYEVSGNETITDNKYIRINPCTWWTIEIDPDKTTGLDLDDVTELVIQFNGRGIVTTTLKKE